jgi:hypothetical protein
VSSSRDFGVEQFFRADEFRAVDPSPKSVAKISHHLMKEPLVTIYCQFFAALKKFLIFFC